VTVDLYNLSLIAVLAPLVGSLITGLAGKSIGRKNAHRITILGVLCAFAAACWIAKLLWLDEVASFNGTVYTWGSTGELTFNIGFLIDKLTALMMLVVTFVSLLVHIYSIGYMHDDPSYQRFFSYISLFTFTMLMLVTGNNFLQLFFGWEGVGLVSYLLIGFWFKKESATAGSLKAFLVNRVGDFGFLLGIAAVLIYFGSLEYTSVFAKAPSLANTTMQIFPNMEWSVLTVICILLFIGAMGKSAQVPLHVWLPESMEGPTPISALIHAATMVTAGIFMVARMSPLFELSTTALATILIIGATGALFLGFLALVQHDIKRVVAYSTLSQLGYMMASLGASAYAAGIFHLATHACFKALLFLAAGSVIMAMHHEQDMRQMGGLRKAMPITYFTFLLGALSLSAVPPFAGFYSKDVIIEAIQHTTIPGAAYAYICILIGSFVTALYSFRALFLTFHGTPRMSEAKYAHLHESPWVVWLPLVILAVPSVILGYLLITPMLFAKPTLLGNSLYVLPEHNVLNQLAEDFTGAFNMTLAAVHHLPFWFALAGIAIAWVCYIQKPALPGYLAKRFKLIYWILINKYGFDKLNQLIFVRGSINLASRLYHIADVKFIDGLFVNGSGRLISYLSATVRKTQSGNLFWYAFVMVLGLLGFLIWLLLR
jgi:NADH-quinone oxidoreductase subunit L